jgi:hypothetical protein
VPWLAVPTFAGAERSWNLTGRCAKSFMPLNAHLMCTLRKDMILSPRQRRPTGNHIMMTQPFVIPHLPNKDSQETQKWVDAFEAVIAPRKSIDRPHYLIESLIATASLSHPVDIICQNNRSLFKNENPLEVVWGIPKIDNN